MLTRHSAPLKINPSAKAKRATARPNTDQPRLVSDQPVKMFTKAFTTGGSQAVRLPKAFRFKTNHIQIERNEAGQIILTEIDENAEAKRLQALQALFDDIRNNPLSDTDEGGFVLPPRELADFRNPFDQAAGEPPLTFSSELASDFANKPSNATP